MSKKFGTYLVEFADGTQIVCGNNYKPWHTHAREYAWYKWQDGRPHTGLLNHVKFSDVRFQDDGGLKYATPKAYQEMIDELTADDGKKRTPFSDIDFAMSDTDREKLYKELKYWGLTA